MRGRMALSIGAGFVLGAALLALYGHFKTDGEKIKLREEKRAFCRLTKNSVQVDLFSFQSGKPDRQQEAIRRIVEDRIYFGDSSVQLCLQGKMPPDLYGQSFCTNDVPCMQARTEKLLKLLQERERTAE